MPLLWDIQSVGFMNEIQLKKKSFFRQTNGIFYVHQLYSGLIVKIENKFKILSYIDKMSVRGYLSICRTFLKDIYLS